MEDLSAPPSEDMEPTANPSDGITDEEMSPPTVSPSSSRNGEMGPTMALEIAQISKLWPPEVLPARPRVGFLDLSAEIRNRIYSFCLVSKFVEIKARTGFDGNLHIWNRVDVLYGDRWNEWQKLYIRILATCRTIHNEAAPILYGANHFRFANQYHMSHFLDMIGDNVKFLRCLSLEKVDCHNEFRDMLWQLLPATGLNIFKFFGQAIQRFRFFDMADDLELLTHTLWSANRGKEGVSMESIVDIFKFADRRIVHYLQDRPEHDDDGEATDCRFCPLWGEDERSAEPRLSFLSYSGHGFDADDETEDESEESNTNDWEKTDASQGKYGLRVEYVRPSKWNLRLRELLLDDLQAAE